MANAPDPPDGSLTSTIRAAIRAVADALTALPARGMIIGGIAVIARGVPRLTRDVDATVDGGGIELRALLEVWRAHDLVPRIDDAIAFVAVVDDALDDDGRVPVARAPAAGTI